MQVTSPDYQEIKTCICERNTKLILRNTGNLKLTNRRASHSRLNNQREQSLSTCVLILVSFKEVGRVHAHLWLQVQVHDHHHHRSPKWPHSSPGWDSEREPCVLTNFGTKQCKWFHLMTKFWNILQQMTKYLPQRNTNLISRNIANRKLRNTTTSQSRFSGQKEQTLPILCVIHLLTMLSSIATTINMSKSKTLFFSFSWNYIKFISVRKII